MNEVNLLNDYCKKGWKIFPVQSKSKLPIIKDWPNLATDDFGQVIQWVGQNDNCNWGMVTGDIIVIDVDPKNGGSLDSIDLPDTLTVRTGSGGYHYYYKNPGIEIRNSVQKLADGIDIRGSGGYVVLPPSVHPNGNTYEWVNNLEIAEFPIELVNKLAKKKATAFIEPEIIEDGKRNDTLFKLGSSLRAKGLTEEAIEAALLVENEKRCKPPLDISEIETIVKSVSSYEQGNIQVNSIEPSLTELGNAERFVNQHSNKLRYCPSFGWLLWDGKRWKVDKTEIYKLAHETAKSIYKEASQMNDTLQSQKLGDWAKSSLSRYRIDSMVKMSEPYVTIQPDELDDCPFYLNVKNGTIDLKTGELLPHDQSSNLTKVIDTDYNPDAECPKWLEFLDLIFPKDDELHRFIQKAVGYSLTGNTDEQCLFFLFGDGENGKSTFVETIELLLGEYTQKTDIENLLDINKRGGTTPHLDKFFKTRFVVTSETEEGGKFNERLIKDLTGGDTIVVNPKYKEVYTFTPTHKLWIFGNHKPEVKDMTHAFWRRMRLIPFEVKIPKDKQKKMSEVLDDFKSEFEGILNWAVQGCLLWQNEGLTPPEKVKSATDEYKIEQDLLLQFLDEECELSPEYRIKKDGLLTAYNNYLLKNGEKNKVSKNSLTRRLKEKDIKVGGNGNRFYVGARLYREPAFVEEENQNSSRKVNEQVDALFDGTLLAKMK